MPTFEDDCSGKNGNTRSWEQDHRTSPRRQPSEKANRQREPYLRIDNRKLFRRDLEDMEVQELDDIAVRLEADNKSIDDDLPTLSGDAEIKAKDKKRFNEQWINTIRNDLLEDDFDGEDEDYDIENDDIPEIKDVGELQAGTDYVGVPHMKDGEPVGPPYKATPMPPLVKKLLASISKHLSPELAAIVIADATCETD